jgi:RNA polymerase sigma factor (sigma-70 family)
LWYLPPILEDQELYERWRSGDQNAGRMLVERYFAPIFRFFRNKSRDHVDDLVQETFLRCLEAKNRFEGRSSFRTYLFRIATFALYEHFRARQKGDLHTELSSAAALEPSPSQILNQRDERSLLLDVLRSLPLAMQITIEFHYWEHLGTAEISEILDVPEGTIKRRLQRAREAIKTAMEKDGSSHSGDADELENWVCSIRKELKP